jgi:hypothetical protein
MSDAAHAYWCLVAYYLLMVILVVSCTVAVAYFVNSAAGLWSILLPLLMTVEFENEKD